MFLKEISKVSLEHIKNLKEDGRQSVELQFTIFANTIKFIR